MATYAIGDLQGCYNEFQCLLEQLHFNPDKDQIWLAGDIVNRGPQSLKTLQHCYDLRDNLITVLGNHDLHMLAVMNGAIEIKRKDNFEDVLNSPNRERLEEWLLTCPLMFEDTDHVLTHAGIYPGWSLEQARCHAREVENVLKNDQLREEFFHNMYGNIPAQWNNALTTTDRWRTITNFFTRMRLIDDAGEIDLVHKESLETIPEGLTPWFNWNKRVPIEKTILFGHWAALEGNTGNQQIIGLDTGCVWGNKLSAYCIETGVWTHCECQSHRKIS